MWQVLLSEKFYMGHIGKPLGYPLQVLAVAVGFTLLSLMRKAVYVAYSFPSFSPFLPPLSCMKSCPDREAFFLRQRYDEWWK